MKNKLFLFLVVPVLCTTLVSCKGKNTNNKIWFAYSTENLISDWDYFDNEEENAKYVNRDKTLKFSCMKNENEGVQLMITANNSVASFDFELPDLEGPNGTISKNHLSVAAAHYMNVDNSNERLAMGGYYPDALIPLENFKFRRMNYIDTGRSQSLYINLKTDKDTPAGEYKGMGKLHLDDEIIDIPFEVKVYDAVLPDEVHQQSAFGLWYDKIVRGELKNYNSEMDKIYYDFIVEKRLSPENLPPEYTATEDLFVENLFEKVANNVKITNTRLPVTINNISKSKVKSLLQKIIDKNLFLRNHGDNTTDLFKKIYFYIDDEPTAAAYAQVREHDKTIFDVKKELCSQLSSYPDLYESFTKIPNIVTREFAQELVATNEQGGIQTWCPQMQHFQTPQNREIYHQRQKSTDRDFGEHVWWYTCVDPTSPYPNFHLDANLMLSRVLRYLQYDYGIEGQLFWNVCYYSRFDGSFEVPRDLWNDPFSWVNCASDGVLVYPGYTFGIKGPITTLRLENILASNEEYEYLWMIDQKVQEYNVKHNTYLVTNDILQDYYARLFENMIIYTDNEIFEEVRIELLKAIEELNSDLDNGMKILMNGEAR